MVEENSVYLRSDLYESFKEGMELKKNNGVKFVSKLWPGPITDLTTVDTLHDLMEGIVPKTLKLIFEWIIHN